MIARDQDQETALCITQLHHSRMTGAIGLYWGNEFIPKPPCFELTQFAAAIHDIGWTEWEKHPRIDDSTGHPVDFLQMDTSEHISIWDSARTNSLGYGAAVALLIYRHNLTLASTDTKPEKAKFLDQAKKHEVELRLLAEKSWKYQDKLTDKLLNRMNTTILLWDYISLRLCMGPDAKNPFGPPPVFEGIQFEMEPSQKNPETFVLDPWPFKTDEFIWDVEAYTHKRGEEFRVEPSNLMNLRTKLVGKG